MDNIGKFEIIETIGEGGMGVVYKGRDPFIERDVAIKVILERALDLPEIKERFYREARSAGKLSHENITVVYEVGEVDGNPYIVMEYLEGEELKKIIKDKKNISLQKKIHYAMQICKGLHYAHSQKIVHRDIKPENIQILKDGKAKIMDFGIAKPEASTLTQTGIMVGTLAYMSPEQIKGIKVDNRSDIFSFGVLLYELLTYKRPFVGDNTTIMYKIVHEEPEKIELQEDDLVEILQEIVSKCLEKNPEGRYRNCVEIVEDLEEVISFKGIQRTIVELLDQGKTLCQQKRPEAVEKFDEVLNMDPEHEEAKRLKQECLENIDNVKTILVGKPKIKPLKEVPEKAVAKPHGPPRKRSRKGLYVFASLLIAVFLAAFPFREQLQNLLLNRALEETAEEPESSKKAGADARDSTPEPVKDNSGSQPSVDSVALEKHAAAAREKAMDAQSRAAKLGAIGVTYRRGSETLAAGDNEIENGNYQQAQASFVAAEEFFSEATKEKEAADLRFKNATREQLISQSKNAQDDASEARSEADEASAESVAFEAYKYGANKEKKAKQFLDKKNYSKALVAFRDASEGFVTAASEKRAYDKAQRLFGKGDYDNSLKELDAIFASAIYTGENRKARRLYKQVERSQINLEQKIDDATNAANRGDLTSAMALLNTLPHRDQEIFEVKNLKKDIISKDKTPPVIQHTPDKEYNPQEPLKVLATAQDNLQMRQVTLYYIRKGTKTFSEVKMQSKGRGAYFFVIPQEYHKGKEIKYCFIAEDTNGNKQNLQTQKKPYKIKNKSKGTQKPQIP